MARILVLDTLKHPSNSGTANIVLSSDETTTMPTVNINGGQIDSTTIGASNASTVAATTLSTTSNTTIGGTLGVTGATTLSGVNTLSGATTCSTTLGVTGNTTLGGSANNVGTITAGTWAATDVAVAHGGTGSSTASAARTALELTNFGKIIKCHNFSHTNSTTGNTNDATVAHAPLSFSITSGKTYLIQTDFHGTGGTLHVNLHAESGSRWKGQSGSITAGILKEATNVSPGMVHMQGVFTASSTGTFYTYVSIWGSGSGVYYNANKITQTIVIWEIENDVVTTTTG